MTRNKSGVEPEHLESHFAKYSKLMPALALMIHLSENPGGSAVERLAAMKAAGWCSFLEAHARRVYAMGEADHVKVASTVLTRTKAGQLPARFRARDLYQRHWSGVSSPEQADRVLGILEEHGWVRGVEVAAGFGGGRPTVDYHHLQPVLTATSKREAA